MAYKRKEPSMVFPTVPIYVDASNWNQQSQTQYDQAQAQFAQLGINTNTNTDTATGTETGSEIYAAQLHLPPVNLTGGTLNGIRNLELGLKCPRCNSTNTKFCYFNNYSLSQPRHLCRSCHRYWTRGGALRNVPVRGGSPTKSSHRYWTRGAALRNVPVEGGSLTE